MLGYAKYELWRNETPEVYPRRIAVGSQVVESFLFKKRPSPDAVCLFDLVFNPRAPFVPSVTHSFADIRACVQSLVSACQQHGSHTRSVVLHGFPSFHVGEYLLSLPRPCCRSGSLSLVKISGYVLRCYSCSQTGCNDQQTCPRAPSHASRKMDFPGLLQVCDPSLLFPSPGKLTDPFTFSDAVANRALTGAQYNDGAAMTAAACIAFCQGKNFAYAGTEYSQECCKETSSVTEPMTRTKSSFPSANAAIT